MPYQNQIKITILTFFEGLSETKGGDNFESRLLQHHLSSHEQGFIVRDR